ncbi:MAG: hypothetical protein A2Y07_04170 [Planctomycetes bacterium GWF2_50_10]|nr:MAG: hypothetical protein A2Y07_04170 [Planctomycetes bacterium GWF2_50_10]
MRRINFKLVIIVVVGIAILAVTAVALRNWQKNRMALGRLTSGLDAYRNANWEQAASDLGKYIVVVPDDVQILLKYADSHLNIRPLKRKNIQHAISTYRAVLRVDPANRAASQRLVELYLKLGMYGESELIASRQLELSPDPNIERMLVASLVAQRKFKESFNRLEQVVKQRPGDVLAYEALTQLCERRPELSDNSPKYWIDKAIETNPDSAMAYIIRAAYNARKDPNAASADLAKAQQLDLCAPATRLRLSQELVNIGMLETAKTHLITLQREDNKDVDVWQTWAMWAIRSQSKDEMLRVATQGLAQLGSQRWDFMPVAVELFIDGEDFTQASKCLDELDKQDVAPASVAYLRGLLAARRGRGYEAVACFQKSIGFGNENPRLMITLAQTLAALGDEQSAINQIRSLVSKEPESIDARLYLSKLLLQNNDPDGAAVQAQELLQYSPNNTEGKQVLAQAYIQQYGSKLAQDTYARSQVAALVNEIKSTGPDSPPSVLLQFQLALQSGQYDQAASSLSTLSTLSPDDPEVTIAAADLLIAQKKTDDAVAQLNKGITKHPDSVALVRYLANLLVEKNDNTQACQVLKTSLDRASNPDTKRSLGLMLADQYRKLNSDQAYSLLVLLDKQFPDDITIKRKLLTFEKVVEDATLADNLIRQIKAVEGQQGWQWRYEQAKLWFVLKNFNERGSQIITLLEENLRANPEDQQSRLLLAMVYDRAGQTQLAISTYENAIARSPRDLRIIIPAVAFLQKAKEFDKADSILTQAAKDNLSHPILTGYSLQSSLRKGHLASATGILEQLRCADPNNQSLDLYLAIIKMRQNDYASASKLLENLRRLQPDSLPVANAFVELSLRQENKRQAIAVCDEIVKKIGSADAVLLRARTLHAVGDPNAALVAYKQAAQLDPNNAQVWFHLGQYYYSLDSIDDAASAIEKALRIEPQNQDMIKQAIELFLQSTNPALAQRGLKMLNTTLAANPADLDLQAAKARALLSFGTGPALDEAVSMLTHITDSNPTNPTAWQLLAQAFLDKNDPVAALDAAIHGLVFLPNNRELLLYKAKAQAASNPQLAIPTLKILHETDPNDSEIALNLAGIYARSNSYKDALEILRKQLPRTSGPVQKRVSVALAIATYKSGDKVQARKLLDQLKSVDINDPTLLLADISIMKDELKYDQLVSLACDWFRDHPQDSSTIITIANDLGTSNIDTSRLAAVRILENTSAAARDSYTLASAYARMLYIIGNSEKAAHAYTRVLELQPQDLVAMNNLAWILCEQQGKFNEALKVTQKGLEISPQYLDLIDTRGMAFFRLGQYQKAIVDFNTCTQLYPANVPSAAASNFHLGRAYAATGEKNQAVRYLQTAMKINSKTGGLSAADVTEAQNLLEGLLKESKL